MNHDSHSLNPMESHRIRGTTPSLVTAARHLRVHLTPAEKILWEALRKRQLNGIKFRCQHPVESFVVDFYCPQHRLIIEVDGDIHDQQVEYDAARTESLNHLGYRVMRFRNREVISNLGQVLQQIAEVLES